MVACSGGGGGTDKAGGTKQPSPVVLTLASTQPFLSAQLEKLPDEIAERSGGTLKIDFKPYVHGNELYGEASLIEDVRAGRVDVAWVRAGAFDLVGVTNFQPLVAPFLVDSYELEGKVFDAGIPQRMLETVDTIGLTGIGVVPGKLSRIMGVAHPFAKRTDFEGAIVGTSGGRVAEEAIRALGATPKIVADHPALAGLDGLDHELSAIRGQGYYNTASAVTANVDLWPEPLAVFMNAARFERLTAAQQEALRSVVADHVTPASGRVAPRRRQCRVGPLRDRDVRGPRYASRHLRPPGCRPARLRQARSGAGQQGRPRPDHRAQEGFGRTGGVVRVQCVAGCSQPGRGVTPLDGVYELTITIDESRRLAIWRYRRTPATSSPRSIVGGSR